MSRLTVMGTMPSPAFQQPVVGLKPTTPVMPAGILQDPPACNACNPFPHMVYAAITEPGGSGWLVPLSAHYRLSEVANDTKTPRKAAHPCLSRIQLCPCAWRLPLQPLRCCLKCNTLGHHMARMGSPAFTAYDGLLKSRKKIKKAWLSFWADPAHLIAQRHIWRPIGQHEA